MTLTVTPLDAPLGAEVFGIDLSRPLDDKAFAIVHQALLDHLVVVIPGLEAELRPLVGFGRRFGTLVPHILDQYHHPETSEVSIISTDSSTGAGRTTDEPAGAFWHSDLSYDANPSDISMLYSVRIPKEGGDTLFANMVAAYEALPDATRARIEGRTAVHLYGYRGGGAVVGLNEDQDAGHPPVSHPIVRTHRESGRKALFVNPGFTVKVEGMAEDDSDALLEDLFAHATRPEFVYRHKWRQGEIVACDNRATMHAATGGYEGQPRTLWRMIVGGSG